MARQTVLVAAIAFQFAAVAASEAAFADFPFMVRCENKGIDRVFYLAKINPNGVAVYVSPDRQAGLVTIDGPAQPVGGDGSGSCTGKTIKQLRDAGQAFDLR